MDNLRTVRNDTRAMRAVVKDAQCLGDLDPLHRHVRLVHRLRFAFGLVLQNQFHRTPVQAAAVTFLGPLLGSLSRPVGGWLADRFGGARVTFVNFVLMALCAAVLIVAADARSRCRCTRSASSRCSSSPASATARSYKMIPGIYHRKALVEIDAGADRDRGRWQRRGACPAR